MPALPRTDTTRYSVNSHMIETILAWMNCGEIAIPEIQRPFVWDSTKVRDLIDSMTYEDYDRFLLERRKLMAVKLQRYYKAL